MHLLYFAWIREKIGKAQEELAPPAQVRDVRALLDWLASQGPTYAAALADRRAVRVAVNQIHVDLDGVVAPGDEVALFPPVTGGLS